MPAVPPDTETALASARGVLFDLDGVLTPTHELHMLAWERLFQPLFAEHAATAYSDDDYFRYVDGKPRVEGVRTALASRGIILPDGDPSDEPERLTLWGLGNRKNVEFWRVLEERGIAPYPGSLQFLDAVCAAGYRVAVVSSSRNANAVLRSAGLRERFVTVVDGVLAADRGLAGKPSPETYLHGARLLGLSPTECVVIEDAVSGVQAGRAGDFGLVVGVDRGTGAHELVSAGADIVVTDLKQLLPMIPSRVSGTPAEENNE